MDINSSDKERYELLKEKIIKITSWDSSKEMTVVDKNKSFATLLNHYVRDELSVVGMKLTMDDCPVSAVFNNRSLRESIKRTQNLTALSKLFTVLKDVAEAAVEIEVEPYRHQENPKATIVKQVRQYISAFCDENTIYPVKISVEERIQAKDTMAYMVISVGEIKKRHCPIRGLRTFPKRTRLTELPLLI